jgi:competence protein ComEA
VRALEAPCRCEEDAVSFEDRDQPAEPVPTITRPVSGRRPVPAPIARLRAWLDWFGPGRLLTSVLTAAAVVGVGWWLLRTPPAPTEAGLPYAGTSTSTVAGGPTSSTAAVPAPATTAVAPTVVVYVAGAVAEPGVYELPAGSRVDVAIQAAGGTRRRAALDALNLAAPLVDGERVYVPAVGETPPVVAGAPAAATATAPAGPVDLNHATAEELDELPGIGPATAAAIVEHREQNGPFATVDDLEAVRGIGPAKLEAVRGLVTV